MRPVEMLLLGANLLTFLILTVTPPGAARWLRASAVSALLIAAAQALLEGPRWQIVPAYGMSVLFFLTWLLQNATPVSGLAGPIWTNRLVVGLAVGLGALGLAASAVLPTIFPVFRFPLPSGPYQVGTLTYHWVDAERPEIFTTDPGDHRELMVQVWYPAKGKPSSPRAPYLPDADALASALARVHHKPKFLFGNLKYITTNAIPAAPVAENEPSYPVLIFLEGLTGFRQMNTFQVEELVSHGYIVAAIDQPYTAAVVVFPDGRQADALPLEKIQPLVRQSYLPADHAPLLNGRAYQEGIIPYLAQDVTFTLDQLAVLNQADPEGILTGRMDMQHVGVLGMSLGGIVAGEACRLEPRLKACLIMDAPMPGSVVRAGLQQPSMWITRDAATMRLERQRAGGWPEDEIHAHLSSMRAVFESLPGDGYFIQAPGMFHINFTDVPYWSPLFSWLGVIGPIDAQRGFNIINAYSLAFFDRHLKGLPAALLDGPSDQFPEVILEKRRP
jgi:predicted dienelactone hydrolase